MLTRHCEEQTTVSDERLLAMTEYLVKWESCPSDLPRLVGK
jgi:hypothetical protein